MNSDPGLKPSIAPIHDMRFETSLTMCCGCASLRRWSD